jgi:hypothetical protein
MDALTEAGSKLGLQERRKDFADLTIDEFTSLLSRDARARRLSLSKMFACPKSSRPSCRMMRAGFSYFLASRCARLSAKAAS